MLTRSLGYIVNNHEVLTEVGNNHHFVYEHSSTFGSTYTVILTATTREEALEIAQWHTDKCHTPLDIAE